MKNNCVMTLSGHAGPVFAITLLNNGYLSSGSGDMTIKVWDTNLGLNKRTLGPIDTILRLTTLSNGNLVCAELNHVMSIWTIDSFKLIKNITQQ